MLAILQGLSEGIAVLDADGTLVFANDVAARLSGFADLGEMRAAGVHSVLSRFHVLDEEGQPIAVEDPAERRARAGQPVERVVRVRRTSPIVPAANGRAATDEDRWILVRATAMAAASGAVGRVIKLYRDITDRKRAESWQRFLGEATSILAGALDEPTKLESVGKLAAGSVADCCALDVADRDGWMTAPVFSGCGDTGLLTRFRERWGDLPVAERLGVAEALRTGRSQRLADGPGAPGADRRRADELRALGLKSLLVVPLATRGQTLGVLALGSATRRYGAADLREAEELARRIAVFVDNGRLYADAQEAVRSREDLLAVVSHDLRNPLGVVLASSALLLHHGADLFENERARRQLEAIQRAANRMNRLIRDLLDFASIQGGRLAISRRVQGAAALIGEALDALEPLASAKQIRLVRGLPETELAVSCDRDRMIQVFSNLVGNAIKFTPEGGTITVEAVPAGDRVRFSVADTGPGIREHELGHVFDRYWQARRRNRDGIGLGLSIAKGIVEAHGGDIWVESPAGAGATFFFTVPVHAP
jgi:signal transduction histidine kinase